MTNRKGYMLSLLTAIMVFNYVDRLALGLMAQDIKGEFGLSDTQLGLLTGLDFALFYAVMGIPIARWADRGNRVTIISVTAALLSVCVALCGAAASFGQLLLVRVGVAVGEAGCHPPALSLIADRFQRHERPRAVARYMLGYPIALLVGYFAAGWLNELVGWRMTFVILGLPGLLLALLAKLYLEEPRLSSRADASLPPQVQPPLSHVLGTLWNIVAFRHLLFCFALSYFFSHGILQWQPTFFIRSYGMQTGELGTWFALIHGLGGLLGTWLGGELASRYATGNERLQLAAIGGFYALLAILKSAVYLAPSESAALVMLGLAAVGNTIVIGPLFAATQTLVPANMRAMSVAIILFFAHLIGMGLGPLAAGVLSDTLRASYGEESLRYSLLILSPGYFWCAWYAWRASRAVTDGIAVTVDGQRSLT